MDNGQTRSGRERETALDIVRGGLARNDLNMLQAVYWYATLPGSMNFVVDCIGFATGDLVTHNAAPWYGTGTVLAQYRNGIVWVEWSDGSRCHAAAEKLDRAVVGVQ